MALAYLLIVLGGSARNGRWAGALLSVVAFLSFNFFLLPPYYTLTVEDPLDWWVLIAFLVTSMVAAQLFHSALRARETAEDRARELERLAALGAESLSVPRAADAVATIARVILGELPIQAVEVLVLDEASSDVSTLARAPAGPSRTPFPLPPMVRSGRVVLVGAKGEVDVSTLHADLGRVLRGRGPVVVLIPLRVRGEVLGVLCLEDSGGVKLDQGQATFADTLTYYAALAVERVRLSAQAEHVEALREADQLKDALLASVSHDLRTPLTTIRALASELRAGGDERAQVIEEEAERLNRLVTDLLDLSRLRAGALPLDLRIIAAEDLVGAALQRLAGLPGVDRIHVALPPDGTLPLGRFDFVHALRALANILENALRHSPLHTPVELDVRRTGEELVFTVSDRGSGVDAGDEERIFEPFFQNTRGEGREGTGLGLAIADSVARAQGGRVVYRAREGGGSVFELRLPGATFDDTE